MGKHARIWIPLLAAAFLWCVPAPGGLQPHAWHYAGLFVAVVLGIILEPLPGGAIGLLGVTLAATLPRFFLYSPGESNHAGFDAAAEATRWALSGFSNATVWLIFAAFMFSLGYARTGLGQRIALLLVRSMGRRTLLLGYAVMLSDALLAPLTPSVTARSAGTVYPVLTHLPPLFGSLPNDRSAARIGTYLMWVAVATTAVTSSLFLTALAPNLLAVEIMGNALHQHLSWMEWFLSAAPMGLLLLAVIPLLAYFLARPAVQDGSAVAVWATDELARMGRLKRQEVTLLVLVLCALLAWIAGARYIDPTSAALCVIVAMLVTGIVQWSEMLANAAAWNTLVWFATLVTMAAGLSKVGVISWFAAGIGQHLAGFPPLAALLVLLVIFYFSHYAFASITAHVTAVLPVFLAIVVAVPGLPALPTAVLLAMQLGIMGVITPYASGPNPVYYGSGYLPASVFWKLGSIFGVVYFVIYMLVAVPWVWLVGAHTFLARP